MLPTSDEESEVVDALLAAKNNIDTTIQDVLRSTYFREQKGRGLIFHTTGSCAILFLAKDIYENEELKNKEVRSLLSLTLLLNRLQKEGKFSIYKYCIEDFYLIQDGFNILRRSGDEILIGEKGYRSANIETIIDTKKNVVYRGIVFRGQTYQLMLDSLVGNFFLEEEKDYSTVTADVSSSPISTTVLNTPTKPEEPLMSTGKMPEEASAGMQHESPSTNLSQRESKPWIFLVILSSLLSLLIMHGMYREAQFNSRLASIEEKIQAIGSATSTTARPASIENNRRPLLYGIDVSRWNGDVLSDLPKRTDISFVIVRATYGIHGQDERFQENWKLATDRGWLIGAYHFFRLDEDPAQQAELFMNTVKAAGSTAVPMIVDIEASSLPSDTQVESFHVQSALISFISHLEKLTHKKPIIYTNFNFANIYLNNKYFSPYSLWLAEYSGDKQPKLPFAWLETGYKIWQKRNNYSIASTHVDFDVFLGSREDFKKLASD